MIKIKNMSVLVSYPLIFHPDIC